MKTIQRKIMLFPLLLAALLAGAVLSLAEDNEFDRLVRNGIEESQHNNYSTALADLRAALKLNPNDANAWYQLGLVFGQMSDSGSAALAFQKAIGLKSDFAQAHFSLGLTLIANPQVQLDWPGAIREFRAALGYQQDYPEALNLLGLGLMKTGDVEAAIPELRHAIRLKPDLSSAHFNLGIALEEREDFDGAAAQYREAIATKGRYPEAATALAKLLLQMGKIEEAKEELQEALRANPDLEDAHYVLARVFQKSGQRQDAAAEFDQAEDLRGRLSRATESSRLSNSGLELASKGDFSSAEASLKQAISLKPDYGLPHYNLGLILADQKGFAGAAQELIKAISLLPGRAKPWFELGRVWRLQGKINAARAAINWASCLAPEDVTIQSTLQSIEESLDPPVSGKEGRGCTRPPDLEVSSDTAEEHIAFARRLSLKRDFLGSQGELLHALAEKPSAIEARLLLANNYGTLGDTKHEELEYRKLLLQRPMDASLHMKLGNLLLLQGNAEDAVSELGIAVKEQPSSASAKTALARALKTLNSRRPAP